MKIINKIILFVLAIFFMAFTNTNTKFESKTYAGRYDKVNKTTYNLLGLPTDRYWLTRKEFHGRHIKDLKIPEHEKRMLKIRFKVWKQTHIE